MPAIKKIYRQTILFSIIRVFIEALI